MRNAETVAVRSRSQKSLTRMYPTVAAAGRRIRADQAVVDGEIVAVDETGRPSLQALQHRGLHPGHRIVFYAFDVLQVNGRDLTRDPLVKRRAQLAKIIEPDAELRGAAGHSRYATRRSHCQEARLYVSARRALQ